MCLSFAEQKFLCYFNGVEGSVIFHKILWFTVTILSTEAGRSDQTVQTQNRLGPKVLKLFSCSTQLSMKFFLVIDVKMPTIVGILTFMSRNYSILGLS